MGSINSCFCCCMDDIDNHDELNKLKMENNKDAINEQLIDNNIKKKNSQNFNKMHNLHAFRRRTLFPFSFPSYV